MEGADEGSKKMAEILKKATYKVNKVEEKGEDSNLDITVKAVNLNKYINEYVVAATAKFGAEVQSNEKDFNDFTVEYFSNVLKNEKDLEYNETNVIVQMKKVDGEWQVINPDELVIAILGGTPISPAGF